jgi:hypothetical protein
MKKDVEDMIRRIAREERISLNKAVLRMLEKAMGKPDKEAEVHDDLDRFSGTWSSQEGAEIEKILSGTRTVDEDLWI